MTTETTATLPAIVAAGSEKQKVPKVSHGRGGKELISPFLS